MSVTAVYFLILAIILHNVQSYWNVPSNGAETDGEKESPFFGSKGDVLGFHSQSYDTAFVTVYNDLDRRVAFYLQSSQCNKCKLLLLSWIDPNTEADFSIDTAWPVVYGISYHNETDIWASDAKILCRNESHFGEKGNYTITLGFSNFENDIYICNARVTAPPQNTLIPIYIAIGGYGALAVFYCIMLQLVRTGWLQKILFCFPTERLISNDLGSPASSVNSSSGNTVNTSRKVKSARLKSLDTFRGISIVIMIFVNYGGGKYWYFVHSKWNGLTLADLAFPWFMFIMGASIKLSQSVLFTRGITKWIIFKKIVRRTVILFVLGCLLDGGNELTLYRIPGVLQRFAIAYSLVATIQLCSLKSPSEEQLRGKFYQMFCDVLDYWHEWLLALVLILIYLGLTFIWLPPGCPTRGYLGPGGPLVPGNYTQCTGGAVGAIDRWFFGLNHIYQRPTCALIYHTEQPFDPEGLLGCITSILMTFFGLQASKILHIYRNHRSRLIRFTVWGVLLGSIGTLLCKASRDDGWIPINKNLWSPSYVTATAGLAFILLAVCYFLIDVKGWWSGKPFFYPGMNSIFIYVGHELLHKTIFPLYWMPFYGTHAEWLAMTLTGTSLWVVVSIWLYHIPFFLKI